MQRYYYSAPIPEFVKATTEGVIGSLALANQFSLEASQRDAWREEIILLQNVLKPHVGTVFLEYSIPRMGKRIDAVLLIGPVIFVLEFKVGEHQFSSFALDQVWDYALDLKNFHEASHEQFVAPILIATDAKHAKPPLIATPQNDRLLLPIESTVELLPEVIASVLALASGSPIDSGNWQSGRYRPTPTIVEAAMALYNGHSVTDISRNDASEINLTKTSRTILEIIRDSKERSQKSVCFVTGVPGAGKTLVGLNIATRNIDKSTEEYSVFLSGNGPLVEVLREALARDKVRNQRELGRKIKKGVALSEVKMFIQNVHHFRDDCLVDPERPPIEHVALFDEAQRAWNLKQTSNFMQRKRKLKGFHQSEPEFLISCMDRHKDWAVIVCLVGGGQEINTGEAGISEWIQSLNRSFPEWRLYISSRLTDSEYAAGNTLAQLLSRPNVNTKDELHLSVSMRSFRAEHVSKLVKQLLDLDPANARNTLNQMNHKYPIALTRNLSQARQWLRTRARGTERYGIVVSSQAERLKPHAIDVKSPMDPVHWFLDGKEDVRSSYYLEDVATEFDVQGLELDWACVTWDGDFRYAPTGWEHRSFTGSKWNQIRQPERQAYLKNAYRVLLTRARQGMVIVVPEGDSADPTRMPEFYDPTFKYLRTVGFAEI